MLYEVITRFTSGVSSAGGQDALPVSPQLQDIAPNPILRGTHRTALIRFALPAAAPARLLLFDTLGREIRVIADAAFEAGRQSVTLDVAGLRPGIYFYSLQTNRTRLTRKLVVIE